MRILLLAPDISGLGGVEAYSRLMARALCKLLGSGEVSIQTLSGIKSYRDGSRKAGIPTSKKVWFAAQCLLKSTPRPDLVICTHVSLAPLAWILRAAFRSPYWVAAHGIEVWGRLPAWKLLPFKQSNKVLAVSEFTRKIVVSRHGIDANRIALLPNALDESFLTHATEQTPKKFDHEANPFILTVGRLASSERYKGHDVVIRALAQILRQGFDVQYVIVGDGDDRARLAELAERQSVQGKVKFAGAVPLKKLIDCYTSCFVFAMPARTTLDDPPKGEGFGIVFLEAMACGRPVIGPNYGAPTEFIRDGQHGFLVNPEDPEVLAEAVVNLLRNPDLARIMGANARSWVLQNYTYGNFQNQLAQLLTQR